ncbi:MAG: CvpA family protein [Chitinophagaceae bacterium]
MILDSVVFILLILAFYRGWKKGLLWAIGSLVAVLVAILFSLKIAQVLSAYWFEQHIMTSSYTLLICFIIVFVAIIWLFRLLFKSMEKLLDSLFLGWVNHVLGALLYSFFTSLVISTFIWLTQSIGLLNKEISKDSKTYSFIEPIAPFTIQHVSEYVPMLKNSWEEVKN